MARLRRGQLEAGGVIVIRIRFGSLLMVLVALALTFVVVGCGDDKPAGDESAEVNSEGLDASGCEPAEQPEPKEVDIEKPTKKLDPDKTYTAVFETNCGNFSVELDVENNPITAGSFAHLVEEGVYDGTWFHRIITDFMNQGGDPKGDGTGGVGYTVREKPSGAYEVGTVAMAKTGADPAGTSGSQFFVITGQNGTSLPPDYAIAGKVVSGNDTTLRISSYAGPAGDEAGTPSGAAVMEKVTLEVD